MKELTKTQDVMVINLVICVQLIFIGACFWYHSYNVLWVGGVWLLSSTLIREFWVIKKKPEQVDRSMVGNGKI
jgi:hypothetical protein